MRSRSRGRPGFGRGRRPRRRRAVLLALTLSAAGAACADSGTDPTPERYSLRVLDGDDQTGLVGSPLPRPLRVQVSELATGQPVPGAVVRWSHAGGSGAQLAEAAPATDAGGVAAVTLTLGLAEGEYRVAARVDGASRSAAFRAVAAAAPSLDPVGGPVSAGQELVLSGSGFLPDPLAHRVTFSGVRGAVLSVRPDGLTVQVPACLTTRTVSVVVRVEGRASNSIPVDVSAAGDPIELAPGEDLLISDTDLLDCRRLRLGPGEAYLIAVQNVGTGTAGTVDYVLLGLGPSGEPTVGSFAEHARRRPAAIAADRAAADRAVSDSAAWPGRASPHDLARRLEATGVVTPAQLRRSHGIGRGSGPVRAATGSAITGPPAVGDTAVFRVLTAGGTLEDVVGRLRLLTGRAEVYVDVDSPAPGFSDTDLGVIGSEFDAVVAPTVERAFGSISDLDANGRVALLFTPAVNRLSVRGSGTFAGGFFYAGDLLPQAGAQRGERLYVAVPDPAGAHSDAVDAGFLMAALPAVIAHEFQHLAHYNQRVLSAGADRTEALWLQEAMAQLAEDLVADALDAAGETERAALFRAGNLDRAQRFLAMASDVSLTATSGVGTLAERGAGWLFARYLYAHLGGDALVARITRSTRLGSETVVSATGEPWPRTYSDWSASLYLDDLVPDLPLRFGYPALDLRAALNGVNDGYLLQPETVGPETFVRSGDVRAASSDYFVLAPDGAGEIAITLGIEDGGAVAAGSPVQARLVRFR